MKTIISWNVNGIRAVMNKGFLDFLAKEQPDILCVQETKAQPDQLEDTLLSPPGYTSYWQSAEKKGYSGTAVFVKDKPISVNLLGDPLYDSEGRTQIIEYPEFFLFNCYYPNSQPERKRLDYKLGFNTAVLKKANELKKMKPVIITGDMNVAHMPIDLANPKTNENNAGYYIEERDFMTKFLDNGYIDTFRHFNQEPKQYTWWSYRFKAREKNIGWRIDYFVVNKEFISKVVKSEIMPEVMGSDHCPVKLVVDL